MDSHLDSASNKHTNIPDLDEAQRRFAELCQTIAALRHPVTGCPWDVKQTHMTLRRFMIEEAYEAAEAMAGDDPGELRDELGDVLLQVVLSAQVARDMGLFEIGDVIRAIDAKMRRRHPHVFAPDNMTHAGVTVEDVGSNWEKIKASERAAKALVNSADEGIGPQARSFMSEAEKKLPAAAQAVKIGKLARRVHFDWTDAREVFAQVRSEIDELAAELARNELDEAKLAEELGDVYFSLAQLCRHLSLDPEVVGLDANRKFLRRFAGMESLAAAGGRRIEERSREELEDLWRQVKSEE